MKKTAESFGYQAYDGPLLEELELYQAKSGEDLVNDQVYSFIDRGNRSVAIRPEMTPTLARMIAQVHKEELKPIRWYSIPNLMRYEKPQKGRLREHWQLNCDIFGAPAHYGEIEILQIIISLFENFGASEKLFKILLNDRMVVDLLFKNLFALNESQSNQLYKVIDKSNKVSPDKLKALVSTLNVSKKVENLIFKYLEVSNVNHMKEFLTQHNQLDLAKHIENFYNLIKAAGLEKYIQFSPKIIRGLDYYTGIVFEVFDKHPDNRRALCGGGTYSNLLQIFNSPPIIGTGFGFGDVTLKEFLKNHKLLPSPNPSTNHLFLTYQNSNYYKHSLAIAQQFRTQNIKVLCHPSPIKVSKAISIAKKRHSENILILESQNIQNNNFKIKNLTTNKEEVFNTNDLHKASIFIKENSSL